MPAKRRSHQDVYAKQLTRRSLPGAEPSTVDPLRFTRPRTAHEKQREAILTALAGAPRPLTGAELWQASGVNRRPALVIEGLLAEGLITKTGHSVSTRYLITEHGRAQVSEAAR